MASTTEDRMKFLEAYANWLLSDDAKLPDELDGAMNGANMEFGQQVAAMDDIGQAILSFVKSVRVDEAKVLHRETPGNLPKLYTLTFTAAELYLLNHASSLGLLLATGSVDISAAILPNVRRGIRELTPERLGDLIDRLNALTIAAHPGMQVVKITQGEPE